MSASRKELLRQLFTYGGVGVALNTASYLTFVLLVRFAGTEAKTTMTALYVIGAIASFLLNRSLSFQHTGALARSFPRFVLSHLSAYALNLIGLWLLVDKLAVAAWRAQGVLVLLVAAYLFVMLRWWVFAAAPNLSASRVPRAQS